MSDDQDSAHLDKGPAPGDEGPAYLASLPVAVLRASALDRNARWMRGFLDHAGVDLAPHGKTTMIPELFARQIADGAWAITLSTLQQVRVAARSGIGRILLANVLADRGDVAWIADRQDADDDFRLICLVDLADAVALLADVHRAGGYRRPIQVLVELGYPGGRTGCRTAEAVMAVARAVAAAAPRLELVGVEGYEGLVSAPNREAREVRVTAYLDGLRDLAAALAGEGLFAVDDFLLTAGGSSFLDIVVDRLTPIRRDWPACRIVLRAGCYFSFDSGHYRDDFRRMRQRVPDAFPESGAPEPALEVWGRVISRPEPGRVIVGLGKRDAGHDARMPHPVKSFRPGRDERPAELAGSAEVVELNDQHAHLAVGADTDLAFGDAVGFGVSHPCTTFDKWRVVLLVDDDYRVLQRLRTRF